MTRLRAFKANGGNALKELLKRKKEMIDHQRRLDVNIRGALIFNVVKKSH